MGAEAAASEWRTSVRVYFQDTDAGGIVYHARYLDYFERARMDWLRELGFGAGALEAAHGVMFVVHSIAVTYHRPARLDELLWASVRVEDARGASLVLAQAVAREGETLVSAHVSLACVAVGELRPVRIPSALKQRFHSAPALPALAPTP